MHEPKFRRPLSTLSHLSLVSSVSLLLLFTSCSLLPKVWVEDKQEFVIPAKHIQLVEVQTHNGSIACKGIAGLSESKIIARIRAGGYDEADANACLASIQIVVVLRGSTLHAGYVFTQKNGWQAHVSFQIEQPADAMLEAKTHNGAITVSGIHARIQAATHNGRITTKDNVGPWSLTTHNGSITASGTSNSVHLKTHNGGISTSLSEAGPIEGSIVTHNGSVHLRIAPTNSAHIRCDTDNGRIQTDLPLSKLRFTRRSLSGELGEASQSTLRLRTHNGNIRLFPNVPK